MGDQPISRRNVFRGAALVGAGAAGTTLVATALPGAAPSEPASLAGRPLVMAFRRVGSLAAARDFVDALAGWPPIGLGPAGEDATTLMYDAGGAVVGLAVQAELTEVVDSCSVEAVIPTALVSNPASALTVSVADASIPVSGAAGGGRVSRGASFAGTAVVVDQAGNQFLRVAPDAREDPALAAKRAAIRSGAARADVRSPLTEIQLRVADLERSRDHYGRLLGLPLLASSERTAHFDVGSLILTLETEATAGEVSRLSGEGRLRNDMLVFHVEAIEESMTALLQRGAGFPRGVENSGIGRIAYFDDPDGHVLCLWAPSGKATNFDFYPQLDRILGTPA